MLIESKIQRAGGTKVDLEGTTYHFRPGHPDAQDISAHVENVEDDGHIGRFLSITEGYRIYRPGRVAAPAARTDRLTPPAAVPTAPADLATLSAEDRQAVAEGDAAPPILSGRDLLRAQTPPEQAPSGSGPEASPAEGGQEPETRGDDPAEDGGKADLDGLNLDELRARYTDLYGKAPNGRLGEARLREMIAAGKQD